MHHFAYHDGVLHAEGVSIPALAEAVGTPFYCYSTATIERHYRVFAEAFAGVPALICYAMKANSNQAVLATLARLGAGADVVSEGELKRALAAGIPTGKIIFYRLGKTGSDMALCRRGCVFGRRAQARFGSRHSARQDHVLRHRQDRARTGARGRPRNPLRQRRVRTRA